MRAPLKRRNIGERPEQDRRRADRLDPERANPGGEHCALQDDNTFLYCQAAVQGKLLLMDIDRQLAATPAAPAK